MLGPELAAGATVKGIDRAVGGQHKHPAASHEGRGECLGGEFLTPDFAAFGQGQQFIALRHHGGQASVTAHTGSQRCAGIEAPEVATGAGIQGRHKAIAAGQQHCVASGAGGQWKVLLADLGCPGLLDRDHRDKRLELSRLGLIGAARAACQDRQNQHSGQQTD